MLINFNTLRFKNVWNEYSANLIFVGELLIAYICVFYRNMCLECIIKT